MIEKPLVKLHLKLVEDPVFSGEIGYWMLAPLGTRNLNAE